VKPIVLCDVDGVVADLMGGFIDYIAEEYGYIFSIQDITKYHVSESPALHKIHESLDLEKRLEEFLALPYVYQDYVNPVLMSVDMVNRMRSKYDVIFITATMKQAPESYVSKFNWCHSHFPDVPMISCPADLKHLFNSAFIIDDRYDTCKRFEDTGCDPFMFQQPWNEAPHDYPAYDWDRIGAYLDV